jgi:general secretion pathway protein D
MALHAQCVSRSLLCSKEHSTVRSFARKHRGRRSLSVIVTLTAAACFGIGADAIAQTPRVRGEQAPFQGDAQQQQAQTPSQAEGTAQIIPTPRDDSVTLNFVNADIQAVIRAVAEITGRNILLDPRVTGTVNIIAPRPVPRALVFSVLESALRAQGFTAVPGEGGMIRIVPEAEAKFHAGPEVQGAGGDQIVTEVFHLDYEQAQQVVTALRPLVSPNNVINAFPATNTLVVTDYAENINRIRRLIDTVDQPNPGELFSIRLQYASALDVLQTISHVMPEVRASGLPPTAAGQQGAVPGVPGGPGGAPTGNERLLITAEARSNSLLVRSYNAQLAKRIRQLVESLDTPTNSLGNLHVIYLRNAEADRIAAALRGLLTGQSGGNQAGTGGGTSPGSTGGGFQQTSASSTGFGGTSGTTGLGSTSGTGGTSSGSGGFGGGPTINFRGGSSGQGGVAFSAGGATVQAYPEMNSLVVIAPDFLYNQLRAAIEELDARRAQIYIEALVVEVTQNKADEFGIQWLHVPNTGTGAGVLGGTNFNVTSGSNILSIASNPTSAPPGLNLGVVNGTVSGLPGITGSILNLGVLARALASDAGTNILSTPTLLTLDNEEAKIVVGQNIPIVTGSFTLTSTAGSANQNPFQTIDRQDVGLQLRVRPQVTQGGGVKLQLYEEVSSVVPSSVGSTQGIITNKRSLESTVLVDDGHVVVIGGLIQDDMENSSQAIPILGSIPILGALFRYDSRTRAKTNLMVFLRPVVLRDADSAATITGDRYDYIRGVQQGQTVPATFPLPAYPAPDLPGQYSRLPGLQNPPVTPTPPGSGPTVPGSNPPPGAQNSGGTGNAFADGTMNHPTATSAVTAQPAPPAPDLKPTPMTPTTPMPPPSTPAQNTPAQSAPAAAAPAYAMPAPTEAR